MTNEEIEVFKNTIAETILPHVLNLSDNEIKKIIEEVSKTNNQIPENFGSMLYTQVLLAKKNYEDQLVRDHAKLNFLYRN